MIQIGRTLLAIAGIMLLVPVTAMAQEDGPDHPPMLGLMPPPGTEKPEGVEMSDDAAEMMDQLVHVFFGMMDVDNSGELSLDELHAWIVPPPGPPMEGEHMEGMEGEEDLAGKLRNHMHDCKEDGRRASLLLLLTAQPRRRYQPRGLPTLHRLGYLDRSCHLSHRSIVAQEPIRNVV